MRRSEGRILTSHTGRLFKPGSGWNGMGGSVPPVPAEQLQHAVTSMVRAQVDIGMDIVSNGQVAAQGSYNVVVRALDGKGTPQIEQEASTYPSGATGYHRLRVQVSQTDTPAP